MENDAEGRGRRVLIVIENLPAPFDRRVWQEARSLREAGYQVVIVCPRMKGYDAPYEEIEGIPIYRHPLPFEARGAAGYLLEYMSALFWEAVMMWRVFFKHGFDVIHACNPPDLIFLNALVFRALFGVRFLFDHHDINPELFEVKFGKRGLFYRAIVLAERLSFRSADVSIATNESYRQIAIERGGMPPERVFVVRSGPDLTRLELREPVPERRHGRRHLVGYVGVMGKQEGIPYLLEAVRVIVRDLERDDVHFTLIGGGPELEALIEETESLGIASFVDFTGRAPDDELLDVLNTADVCVNPDEHNPMNDKSTMNKIMEYMALGKPIVQFDLTEGRVSAQDASLYAKPNDARDLAEKIVALLDDPALRDRMGRIGRERVERDLAWPHEVPKLLEAYRALWIEPA
jgi:glycosyltransferase involved in cell wall biosynthesis